MISKMIISKIYKFSSIFLCKITIFLFGFLWILVKTGIFKKMRQSGKKTLKFVKKTDTIVWNIHNRGVLLSFQSKVKMKSGR